jgi:hypothetical protein
LLSEFAIMALELNLRFSLEYLIVFGVQIHHVLEFVVVPDLDCRSRWKMRAYTMVNSMLGEHQVLVHIS